MHFVHYLPKMSSLGQIEIKYLGNNRVNGCYI